MSVVILSRDHVGKPGHHDMGATFDLNKNKVIEITEQEAMLTGYIALAAEQRLRELGHAVIPISDGWYYQRHSRANTHAMEFPGEKSVYVALHLNAGGGDYGSVFHHYSSKPGRIMADYIADELSTECPELTRTKVWGAAPGGTWDNAWNTIRGVGKPIALVYEPAFMDNPDHAPLFKPGGLVRLGCALADGIARWTIE